MNSCKEGRRLAKIKSDEGSVSGGRPSTERGKVICKKKEWSGQRVAWELRGGGGTGREVEQVSSWTKSSVGEGRRSSERGNKGNKT